MAKNLIKTIQNTIFQQALFKRGAKIVLGVSGGADSVCLLDVLAKIAPKAGLELLIAHVNYGLRGKDSDKDAIFVAKLASRYKLKFKVLEWRRDPVPTRSDPYKITENVLRETRYAFFEKVRRENNFDSIAVAHNADDQVETFLMRIIRGAGLQGLAAMKYKSNKILRPLLGISRKEILEYLNANKLKYRMDKTNNTNIFFRNKIRNKLIPYLEKNFNPNIRQTILDSVGSIADDLDLIEGMAKKTYKANKTSFLSVKEVLKLHPALQRRILLKFIEENRIDLKDIESAHIEEVIKILKSTKGKNQIVVFKGLKISRKGDKLVISKTNN